MDLGCLSAEHAAILKTQYNHSSQTTYEPEDTWNAFVVPISVQWHLHCNRILHFDWPLLIRILI